jgi:hypothetical protein
VVVFRVLPLRFLGGGGETQLFLVFPVFGYDWLWGAARGRWDSGAGGAADPQLQLRCYRALYRAWHDHPQLAGLYAWNWFGEGGPNDRSYTPRGKPAEALLRHWYTASR